MIGDLENDTVRSTEDYLADLIGCNELVIELFDHGAELGMSGRCGNPDTGVLEMAVKIPVTGAKEHRSNSLWIERYPLMADYLRAAIMLKEKFDRGP